MRCKPQLIFRGAEGGQKPKYLERKQYHLGVDVLFNPTAWANETTMLSWLQRLYRRATVYNSDWDEPQLLAMDAFLAHLTPAVCAQSVKVGVTAAIIPDGSTGYVQPLDIAINQPLKALIKDASDHHREKYSEEYEAGKWRSEGETRIVLTVWVGEAFKELHEGYQDTIIESFRHIGLSLNTNGSKNKKTEDKGAGQL